VNPVVTDSGNTMSSAPVAAQQLRINATARFAFSAMLADVKGLGRGCDLDRGDGDRAHQGRRPSNRPTSTPAIAIGSTHERSGHEPVGRAPRRPGSDERATRRLRPWARRLGRNRHRAGKHVVDGSGKEFARRLLGDGRKHALTHPGDDAPDRSVGVISQPGPA
jgi:hypothetical protein